MYINIQHTQQHAEHTPALYTTHTHRCYVASYSSTFHLRDSVVPPAPLACDKTPKLNAQRLHDFICNKTLRASAPAESCARRTFHLLWKFIYTIFLRYVILVLAAALCCCGVCAREWRPFNRLVVPLRPSPSMLTRASDATALPVSAGRCSHVLKCGESERADVDCLESFAKQMGCYTSSYRAREAREAGSGRIAACGKVLVFMCTITNAPPPPLPRRMDLMNPITAPRTARSTQ